jgi:hypothetical protein
MHVAAKLLFSFVAASVVTTLAVQIALPGVARTHGNPAPAAFLFPYAMLTAHAFQRPPLPLVAAIALLQFFVYSAFFAWAWILGRRMQRISHRIIVVHVLLGIGCALLYHFDS